MAASVAIVTMMRTLRPGGGGPRSASVCFSSSSAPSPMRRLLRPGAELSIGAEQLVEDLMDGLKSIEDVAFRAPQRGEAEARELRL